MIDSLVTFFSRTDPLTWAGHALLALLIFAVVFFLTRDPLLSGVTASAYFAGREATNLEAAIKEHGGLTEVPHTKIRDGFVDWLAPTLAVQIAGYLVSLWL